MNPVRTLNFSATEIDRVRSAQPLSDIIGRFVDWDLRKSQPAKGDFWACCPFHGDKSPSFHVDDGKGFYHCFGCGAGGDVFAFLKAHRGYSFRQAVEMLGGDSDEIHETAEERASREAAVAAKREAAAREAEADAARRHEIASDIWEDAGALTGSHGEMYFHDRGLPEIAWPSALRFHRRLKHPSGDYSGAIIARVDGPDGRMTSIWRIFVTAKGKKAFGADSKLGLGDTNGGAVRLWEPGEDGGIETCEGLETGVAIRALSGGTAAVWPCLSTSGIQTFMPPFTVRSVRVWVDGDLGKLDVNGRWRPPAGIEAGRKLRARLREEDPTLICRLVPPPAPKADFLDVWNSVRDWWDVSAWREFVA